MNDVFKRNAKALAGLFFPVYRDIKGDRYYTMIIEDMPIGWIFLALCLITS